MWKAVPLHTVTRLARRSDFDRFAFYMRCVAMVFAVVLFRFALAVAKGSRWPWSFL